MPNELESTECAYRELCIAGAFVHVQRAARNADRTLAAEIRHQLRRLYTSKPQVEKR